MREVVKLTPFNCLKLKGNIMYKKVTNSALAIILGLFLSNVQAYSVEGVKWGDPMLGTGATISWSIIDTVVACDSSIISCDETTVTPLSDFMPTGFENEIRRAFDTWSAAADITFIEMADGGGAFSGSEASSFVADIRLGGMAIDGPSNTLGYAYYPYSILYSSVAGDMLLDSAETFSIGSGIDIFSLILHELGHSLGLGHSEDSDAIMYPWYGFDTELHPDDIAGIQQIYGVSAATVPLPAAIWLMLSGLVPLMLTPKWRTRKTA